MEISGLELQLKAVSGSVTLWQSGSVLKVMGPLPLKALGLPGVWAGSWGHVGVRGPCCCQAQADLSDLW